jgi:hypothetical protein
MVMADLPQPRKTVQLVRGLYIDLKERGVLQGTLDRVRAEFGADPAAAARLLAVGESPRDPQLDPLEHAAWTAVCSVILNLDETLTKE